MMKRLLRVGIVAGVAVLVGASLTGVTACQTIPEAVQVDSDDIGGVVSSAGGPEPGVWVIAETTGLPTGFRKIVVTDDLGRYVVPDLPTATYDVWVRGYGLVDSPKVQAEPGQVLDLTAVTAPTPQAAAQYYPSNYWYSLLQGTARWVTFPAPDPTATGLSTGMASRNHWIGQMKSGAVGAGCTVCHQLGNKATREIPESLGAFDSTVAAWDRRVQSGQSGASMSGSLSRFGRRRALEMYADWTDRITAGDVPPVPPRPRGVGAQPGHHPVGLVRPEGVRSRHDLNRQAESHPERERPRVRSSGVQRSGCEYPGSDAPHRDADHGAGSRF